MDRVMEEARGLAAYAAGFDADGGDRNLRCVAGALCAAPSGEPGDGNAARADAAGGRSEYCGAFEERGRMAADDEDGRG